MPKKPEQTEYYQYKQEQRYCEIDGNFKLLLIWQRH